MISGIKRSRIYQNSFPLLSLILLSGLALRIFLSSFWTYQPDFGTWTYWANGIREVGFSNFYGKYWCDYMPGYLYVLWFLQLIHAEFQNVPVEILFKLPANLSDLGISILIFYALKRITSLRIALLSSIVYFFNPAVISNSVFWGQVDSVHTLPILFSIILVLEKRFMMSGIFAALAFMIKPQSFVIFPILWVVSAKPLFNKQSFPKIKALLPTIKIIVAMIISMLALTVPFIAGKMDSFGDIFIEPISLIRQRFEVAYSQYKYASLNAFNFWGMLTMWKSDATVFMNITYQTWGTIIFAVIYALILGLLFRFAVTRKDEELGGFSISIYYSVTLVLFGLFLFVTRAHERHLLPTIVFFTIVVFVRREYWLFYGAISFIYVLNMFYSYLDLTHRIEKIPPAPFQVIVDRLIPGIVILVLFVFVVLMVDFWRSMTQVSHLQKLLVKNGG
jgi:Gpi18-like mannosyltransferase